MAFRFSLAAVLRYRESLEHKEQLLLEQCYQRLSLLQHRLAQIDSSLSGIRKTYHEIAAGSTVAMDLHVLIEQRVRIESQKVQILNEIEQAQNQLRQQMDAYRSVRQKREIVSELRNQRFEQYRRAEDVQEQKMRDDLFLLRRQRRK